MPPDVFDPIVWTDYTVKLVAATLLSAAVGLERQLRGKTAGLRTHILVCLGSLIFTLLGMDLFARSALGPAGGADPTRVDPLRIVEAIVGGLGFLGAGAIIRGGGGVQGLTTATSIWTMGALGVAVGIGNYPIAILAMVFSLIVLWLIDLGEDKLLGSRKPRSEKEGEETW